MKKIPALPVRQARHKFLLIAITIEKNFNEDRLFIIFVPEGFSGFSLYFLKFF